MPAYVNLADLFRLQRREPEGEQLLRRALEIDPVNAAAHHALGLLLVRTVGCRKRWTSSARRRASIRASRATPGSDPGASGGGGEKRALILGRNLLVGAGLGDGRWRNPPSSRRCAPTQGGSRTLPTAQTRPYEKHSRRWPWEGSLLPQDHGGIDLSAAARRQIAGAERSRHEHPRRQPEDRRILRAHLEQQARHRTSEQPAPTRPSSTPRPASSAPRPSTSSRISDRRAPRAMRTPISGHRWAAKWEVTPKTPTSARTRRDRANPAMSRARKRGCAVESATSSRIMGGRRRAGGRDRHRARRCGRGRRRPTARRSCGRRRSRRAPKMRDTGSSWAIGDQDLGARGASGPQVPDVADHPDDGAPGPSGPHRLLAFQSRPGAASGAAAKVSLTMATGCASSRSPP